MNDWEHCPDHDCPAARCRELHSWHWTSVAAIGVALLMALVLLGGIR